MRVSFFSFFIAVLAGQISSLQLAAHTYETNDDSQPNLEH